MHNNQLIQLLAQLKFHCFIILWCNLENLEKHKIRYTYVIFAPMIVAEVRITKVDIILLMVRTNICRMFESSIIHHLLRGKFNML